MGEKPELTTSSAHSASPTHSSSSSTTRPASSRVSAPSLLLFLLLDLVHELFQAE